MSIQETINSINTYNKSGLINPIQPVNKIDVLDNNPNDKTVELLKLRGSVINEIQQDLRAQGWELARVNNHWKIRKSED